MKKAIILFFITVSSVTMAQNGSGITFGLKAGLNYGDNGEIEIRDLTGAGSNIITEDANDRIGYHFGVFLRGDLSDKFYLKPELQYTKNSSSYTVDNRKLGYDIQKLDLPILAGVRVLKVFHVFGGPSLQYMVENDLDDVRLGDVKNEFTIGFQFGTGIQIGPFNADIRYERGFTDNQAQAIDTNTGSDVRVDSRPNQFILSIGLDL
ncbi:porin family protein [Aquimarina brevivitae]|uniref:Outer membrane protein with beta-barrel domain n=1 Tax=Aquimarina brevivitae TaxID=323412 RepID=A0A4Q7P1M1_9FLAO|nr:porin family protein [Aquimarina brevivitae]RZS93218.1 outer membrane protein with beta-barrel domain [Aquimarina brevivitae]